MTLSSTDKECLPENLAFASKSCICLFGDRRNLTTSNNNANNNSTIEPILKITDGEVKNGEIRHIVHNDTKWGFEIHYKDFTCDEVLGTWLDVILSKKNSPSSSSFSFFKKSK